MSLLGKGQVKGEEFRESRANLSRLFFYSRLLLCVHNEQVSTVTFWLSNCPLARRIKTENVSVRLFIFPQEWKAYRKVLF